MPALLVGPRARGIGRIPMFFAFFPPHSETSHRSPLRHPAGAWWTARFAHCGEWPAGPLARCHI
jgi:hypothetical protein